MLSWYIQKKMWKFEPDMELTLSNQHKSFYQFSYDEIPAFKIYLSNCYDNTEICYKLLDHILLFNSNNFELNIYFNFKKEEITDNLSYVNKKKIIDKKLHSIWDNKFKIFWDFNKQDWYIEKI